MSNIEPVEVSVVTITYNQKKYIAQMIESIVSQKTKFKFELIIADDASSDGTDKIVKNYATKYPNLVKPILRKRNLGAAKNSIDALSKSTGKYISLCEGDDYWTDDSKLQKQYDMMEADKGINIVFHPALVHYEKSERADHTYPSEKNNFNLSKLLKYNFIQTNTVMYRKKNYNEIPNEIMPLDWYLHLYHANDGNIGFINKTMSVYRKHNEGIWWQGGKDKDKIWIKYGRSHLKLYLEMLRMFGDNSSNKEIILDHISDLAIKLVDIDNRKNTKLVEGIMDGRDGAIIAEALSNRINQQNRIIKLKDDEIDSIKSKITKYKSKIHALDSELSSIKSSRAWRVATRLNKASYNAQKLKLDMPLRKGIKVRNNIRSKTASVKKRSYLKSIIAEKYGIKIVSDSSKPDISLVLSNVEHPTSSAFIRLISPLSEIKTDNGSLRLELIDGARPHISRHTKKVIVQRTALPNENIASNFVNIVKEVGARLYVDTDDAFGELDKNHPQYTEHVDKLKALVYVMDHADEIWFSTYPLKELYENKNSFVIGNTLDPKLWPRLSKNSLTPPKSTSPLRMVYMGTSTHDGDFEVIEQALEELYKKYPGEFELHVVGVTSRSINVPYIKRLNPENGLYPNFVKWFNNLDQFDVGLSPLADSEFNSFKSDIKCLDYLACGIHPVVSDVRAYDNKELDGLITRVRNSHEAWHNILEILITNRESNRSKMKEAALKGKEYILSKRTALNAANILRNRLYKEGNSK